MSAHKQCRQQSLTTFYVLFDTSDEHLEQQIISHLLYTSRYIIIKRVYIAPRVCESTTISLPSSTNIYECLVYTDGKAESFAGTGKFIYQNLRFRFCFGAQITVIGIQEDFGKILKCQRFRKEAMNSLPAVQYRKYATVGVMEKNN